MNTALDQAWQYYHAHDYKASETAFRKVLSTDPYVAQAHLGLGLSLMRLGKNDDAAKSLRAASTHDSTIVEAPYQLGFLAERRSHWSQARDYYNRVLTLEPGHKGAQVRLSALPQANTPNNATPSPGHPRGGQASIPVQTPSSVPTFRRAWRHSVVGYVTNHRERVEQRDYRASRWQIWTFDLQPLDIDDPQARIPVQLRGRTLSGNLQNGELVEVPGRWRRGLWQVNRVCRQPSGAMVSAQVFWLAGVSRAWILIIIGIICLVAAFAVATLQLPVDIGTLHQVEVVGATLLVLGAGIRLVQFVRHAVFRSPR